MCLCTVWATLDLIFPVRNRELCFSAIMWQWPYIDRHQHHKRTNHHITDLTKLRLYVHVLKFTLNSINAIWDIFKLPVCTRLTYLLHACVHVCICAFHLALVVCGYAWASQNLYLNFCLEFIQICNMLKNILPILRSKSSLSSASKRAKVGILPS